jgi:hypothetical protein
MSPVSLSKAEEKLRITIKIEALSNEQVELFA